MGVKMCVNGEFVEMTQEEIAEMEAMRVIPDYKESVISAIREKYSVDDELAILRQRDSKPDEFAEYFAFVENIKQGLKANEITDAEAQALKEVGENDGE